MVSQIPSHAGQRVLFVLIAWSVLCIEPVQMLAQTRGPEQMNWPAEVPFIRNAEDGGIFVGSQHFKSWERYLASDAFQQNGRRCATPYDPFFVDPLGPSDCSYNKTNPKAEYDPSVASYRIPVVFHVIRADDGITGHVPEDLIRSQIEVLNEDYLAIPGTNGENGTDCRIEFELAKVDPDGNATDGITYSDNTTWYNDQGAYYETLAWDPHRYLNIYTNSAGGSLGYVPWLPQNGDVGSNADRVVLLWSTVGKNAPVGFPYDLGRTATHEVGHFLGLFHTFQDGCESPCDSAGDRICDTNSEELPHFGCDARSSCGTMDPIDNYLDYSDDRCMERFTHDQARRMRCTLANYRPDVYSMPPSYPLTLEVEPLNAGQRSRFTVRGGESGAVVAIVYGTKSGESGFRNQSGWCATFNIEIRPKKATKRIVAKGTFNSEGVMAVQLAIPEGLRGRMFLLQAAQKGTCPEERMSDIVIRTVQ